MVHLCSLLKLVDIEQRLLLGQLCAIQARDQKVEGSEELDAMQTEREDLVVVYLS